jgi:hypothetical protein
MPVSRNANQTGRALMAIIVTAIEPIDYGKKLVHLIDDENGEMYEITYGSSVSDFTIRLRAPMLVRSDARRKGK